MKYWSELKLYKLKKVAEVSRNTKENPDLYFVYISLLITRIN